MAIKMSFFHLITSLFIESLNKFNSFSLDL